VTQTGASNNSAAISNYAYTLGAAGNRLTVAELTGRRGLCVRFSLPDLRDRAGDPGGKNGPIGYTFDAVYADILGCYASSSTVMNCTGFCTDCPHPGLTGVYCPFLGMLPEVIEAKGRRFIIRSL
jgi:hypothetical protein